MHALGFCLTEPFSRVSFRLGQCPKVNSWELLRQNFHRPYVLPLVKTTATIAFLAHNMVACCLWVRKPRVGFGAHVCYHCRISPPRFLAECRKRRLNQGSFVLLFFRLYALFDLCLVFACLFACTAFVLSFCVFVFLYCFVCQYQSSDWLGRPPPK